MEKKIISPIPGLFYRKPSPEDPPFKEVGDQVKVGDTIGLVEVMKTFHEIKSEVEGTIKNFLIENETPVQAGQTLINLD